MVDGIDVKPDSTPAPSADANNAAVNTTPGTAPVKAVSGDDPNAERIPRTRLNEEIESKKHYQSLYEENKAKLDALQAEQEARNKPPVATGSPDPFLQPEEFSRDIAKKEMEPLNQAITSLMKDKVEGMISSDFEKDSNLQEYFGGKDKMFKAVAEIAVKYGHKTLTPQIMQQAYNQLMIDNRSAINKIAEERGAKAEREKARTLDGSIIPTGPGSSPVVRSSKPTQADKSILSKVFGKSDDEISKMVSNIETDDRGNRKIIRGGSNG